MHIVATILGLQFALLTGRFVQSLIIRVLLIANQPIVSLAGRDAKILIPHVYLYLGM
jgi:hypothetical protein